MLRNVLADRTRTIRAFTHILSFAICSCQLTGGGGGGVIECERVSERASERERVLYLRDKHVYFLHPALAHTRDYCRSTLSERGGGGGGRKREREGERERGGRERWVVIVFLSPLVCDTGLGWGGGG